MLFLIKLFAKYNLNDASNDDILELLNKAFEILIDPVKREIYDNYGYSGLEISEKIKLNNISTVNESMWIKFLWSIGFFFTCGYCLCFCCFCCCCGGFCGSCRRNLRKRPINKLD
jgi:DnaJ-class molecular chaperone